MPFVLPEATPSEAAHPTDALSERGRRLVEDSPTAEYIQAHLERADDTWDPVANPGGYIGLCIAENKLVWDLLEPKLTAPRDVPATAIGYDQMIGSERLRTVLAGFLGRHVVQRAVAPDSIAVLGGAGSVLELLFYVIADAGDGILVPTPSYAGFWADIETRNQQRIVPVHTTAADGFRLRVADLDAACAAADRPVRALLLASPSNPLGRVYARAELDELLAWAEQRSLHVVFDELFALSVFGSAEFVSGGELRPALGDRVHLVWAVSKDLAASGLRCGVLVTENVAVIEAVGGLAYWAAVSGDTQHLVATLLDDEEWTEGFFAENRRRLGKAYAAVTGALDTAGIPYLPAQAAFFFLVDVRPYLPEVTWEAEDALWRRLVEDHNLNLTPGSACRIGEPGFLRLCFAGVPSREAVAGVARLAAALRD